MEKLIELLREYIRLKYEYWEYWVYLNEKNKLTLESQHSFMGYWINEEWYTDEEFWESIIISKQFGFIKWLVDNDKIDRDRCECRQLYNALKRSEDAHWDKNFSKCERIVMLLAIQDSPIEYLISVLK